MCQFYCEASKYHLWHTRRYQSILIPFIWHSKIDTLYCILVIVFIYQTCNLKDNNQIYLTRSVFNKNIPAGNWLYSSPLNFTYANSQIIFFPHQDQSRSSTLEYWHHTNIVWVLQNSRWCYYKLAAAGRIFALRMAPEFWCLRLLTSQTS